MVSILCKTKFINYYRCFTCVVTALDALIENLVGNNNLYEESFRLWHNEIIENTKHKVNHLKSRKVSQPVKQVLRNPQVSSLVLWVCHLTMIFTEWVVSKSGSRFNVWMFVSACLLLCVILTHTIQLMKPTNPDVSASKGIEPGLPDWRPKYLSIRPLHRQKDS